MKRQTSLIILMLFSLHSVCQNLIPNPSFEDTLRTSVNSFSAKEWISPTQGSPDYFYPLNLPTDRSPQNYNGFQVAKSGVAYSGLGIYALYRNTNTKRLREYIQTKLKSLLIKDTTYCIQLFLSLSDSSQFASRNQMGVYFSTNQINSTTRYELPVTPQIIVSPTSYITDKQNWLQFDFTYKAIGGEEYITLGNFNDTLGIDTVHVGGGIDPPYQNTYYYVDDIYLGPCDSLPYFSTVGVRQNAPIKKNTNVYPNPFKNDFYVDLPSEDRLSFKLYNGVGQIFEVHILRKANRYTFSVGDIPKGLYFFQISSEDEQTTIKLLKN